jgi:large repetitive protein
MHTERALSDIVSTILIISLIIILALVTFLMFYGQMPFQQKSALVASEIKNDTIAMKNVITIFHRAGDEFHLNSSLTGLHEMSINIDTWNTSWRAEPVQSLDTVKPGSRLIVYYNASKKVYQVTTSASDVMREAQNLPDCPLSIRLVDETAHIAISSWNWTCTPFPQPSVTSLSPASGSRFGGTLVTITGTGFTDTALVSFGGTAGTSVIYVSDSQITARSPARLTGGTVDVTVTTSGGTSPVVAGDRFTYTGIAPNITSLTPNSGPVAGGTAVTITGTGFTSASTVSFGGTAGTSVTFVSDTSLTVTSPARAAGVVDVRVTTVSGTSAVATRDRFTYVAVPTVTSITPTSGPSTGGTTVTITGTRFTNTSTVRFGSTAATNVTYVSATSLTAISPSNIAGGTVDVRVTTAGGTSAIVAGDRFTYTGVAPTVTSITPASGTRSGGTTVTITGTGFSSASTVSFGGTAGTAVTFVNTTRLTVRSPARATGGTVDLTVTTVGGTSVISPADQFTYTGIAPAVTSLSPSGGSSLGGDTVTITGTGFTSASTVSFGGTAGTTVTFVNASRLTVISPSSATGGTIDVRVTTVSGTSAVVAADRFTYSGGAPTITSISPAIGSRSGGTTVTITGNGFTSASTVSFGGTAGTSVTFVNATRLTARSPAHAAGVVDVTVTTVGGTSAIVAGDQFTYPGVPAITGISPGSGPAGTTVTITGTGFTSASTVSFGGTAGTGVVYVSDTQVTANSPVSATGGTVDVRVTTIGGTSAVITADRYTYSGVAPSVSSITPATGTTAGGTTVTITGIGFTSASTVSFGGTAGTSVTFSSATRLTARSPAHAAGVVDITVTTVGGTSANGAGDQFTYIVAPTVTGLSTASGPAGTTVTITGTGFTSGSTVSFGGSTSTGVTYVSATQITATSPVSATGGTVDVRVTTSGVTSAVVTADRYTYTGIAPVVSSITPATGSAAGGTTVTITGTGFTSGSTVSFSGTPGTSVTFSSATRLTVRSPAHAAGVVDITVTTVGGTSANVAGDQFTYS